jgi:hypothetical protein
LPAARRDGVWSIGRPAAFRCAAPVDEWRPSAYVFCVHQKERSMRPIIGVIVAAFAVLSLAGCNTTSSADNTTYARPPVSDGGVRVPLN